MNSLVIVAITLSAAGKNIEHTDRGDWQIQTIRYGRSLFSEKQLIEGGSEKRVPMDWNVWLLRDGRHTVLVDTGFRAASSARRFGIEPWSKVAPCLQRLGIAPASIETILLTHMHWDHAGGVADFPNATVWVQTRALETAARGGSAYPAGHRQTVLTRRRLRKIDGTADVAPGLRVERTGGHTRGSQIVIVSTPEGRRVLAGDEAYRNDNLLGRPIGAAYSKRQNRRALARIAEIQTAPNGAIPGHQAEASAIDCPR